MVAQAWMGNVPGGAQNNSDDGAIITIPVAAVGAASYASAVRYNPGAALRIVTNITAITTATVTVTVNLIDQASGAAILLLASAGLTTAGTNVLLISPLIAASANAAALNFGGPFYQVSVGVAGASAAVAATISAHHLKV